MAHSNTFSFALSFPVMEKQNCLLLPVTSRLKLLPESVPRSVA